jgi:allantoicase
LNFVKVDTAFFTGNFSPKVSIFGANLVDDQAAGKTTAQLEQQRAKSVEARPEFGRMGLCASEEEFATVAQLKTEDWSVLVPLTPLGAGYEETRKTMFHIQQNGGKNDVISHLRINMGPDGGIARIRVYGEVVVSPSALGSGDASGGAPVDLLSVQLGGLAVSWSNKHYGHPRNLVAPGRGNCMGDGWETARQPKRPAVYQKGADGLMVLPGYDWALLKLGRRAYAYTPDVVCKGATFLVQFGV